MPTALRMIIVKLTHDNIRDSANQCNEDKNIKTSLFRLQKQYSAQRKSNSLVEFDLQSPLERHLLLMDNNNKMRNTENVLKSNYSRTCSRENVCKFLFHCYTYAYGALVQGVWCTVRVQRKWKMDVNDKMTACGKFGTYNGALLSLTAQVLVSFT
ncbi:hypothetical protein T03_1669 [Trichinella britovi]|uniref:Uncharacterized protein n=1 Tax=Trichinella britovi TaxID=45882 RepID=A0A0V1DIL0_TRIBR|nr:hypothetical protein T03_1669 [Trichinella britovi]